MINEKTIELIQKIAELLASGSPLVIILTALFFCGLFFKNIKNFFNFIDELQNRKISKLMKIHKSSFSSEPFKKFLEEEVKKDEFYQATGIFNLSKSEREKILDITNDTELGIFHFKRARRFLQFNDGKLKIKISKFDKFNHNLILCLSIMCGIFAFILFEITILTALKVITIKNNSFQDNLTSAVLLLVMAICLLPEMLPVYSAKIIAKELESYQQ